MFINQMAIFINIINSFKKMLRLISNLDLIYCRLGYDSKILRFMAALDAEKGLLENIRDFIISYYLEDNTLSVYEIPKDNSGSITFFL